METHLARWLAAQNAPLASMYAQADKAAQQIKARFLEPGGVVSTLTESSEQWDYPNGFGWTNGVVKAFLALLR